MRRLGRSNLRNAIKEVSGIPKAFRDDVLKNAAKAKVIRSFIYLL